MGSYRLSRWAFFLMPLFAFADFGVSDSATLNQIAIDVAHAANASQGADSSLVDIRSDTAYLSDVVYDAQQNLEVMQGYLYRLTYPGLRTLTNAVLGILEKLNTDPQRHLSGLDTSTYQESIYVHDVRNDDIYTRLGDLQDSINNLTNYLCYSPSFVTSINTNLPFLLMSLNFYQGDAQLKNAIRGIYQSLYGRSPSSDELNSLLSLTKNNNITRNFGALLLRDLPYSSLSSSDMQKYQYLMQYYGWQGSNPQTVLRNAGDIRYAYYGTRVLTDTTIGISNVVANITNLLFDVESGGYLEQDTTPGGHGFRVGTVVKEGVSSVMEDSFFTGSVSTNIVGSIDTNNVAQVADNSYNTDLNELKSSTPQDFTELDGVLSEINTASGAIESVAEALSQDHNGSFILRLPFSMPRVGSVDLSLTLDNMTSHTAPVVNLIRHFLQIAIAIYFFRVGWSKVVATVNFHNAEDPF